ncbi:hypothetical protein Cgig2_015080 [Carnegiea gigantea]|uniref:Uncharacterized protein n=1 Tax=Carnegiea gigantea TaxID=171969 RepID=A0A9Q1GH85_9CARY|nr:hypothetical protein Cgig2_015080 [Carnegiea gigantea]
MHYWEYEWILKSLVDVKQIVKYNLVDFRGKRCKDQWFPTAIHWTTDAIEQRNKDEKESIVREGETKLQEEFVSVARETQKRTNLDASIHGSLPAPYPPCSKYGSEREPPMARPNDLIEDEHFLNDPGFFDAYLKTKVIMLKSPIKRTNTRSSSPAYDEEQVSLGECEGQHTSMHDIENIALQYSKLAHHKAQ